MKRTLISIALGALMGVAATPLWASDNSAAVEAQREAFNARQTSVDTGIALLENVRAAVLASYMNNNFAWPASTNALVATGFTNNITSQWGESVAGGVSGGGNSYTLNLTAPLPAVAQSIAGKMGAVANGNIVAVNIPVPSTASIVTNGLMRVAVNGRPDLNQMNTNLDMTNYDINNIRSLTASTLNGGTANLDTVTVKSGFNAQSDAAFSKNVTIAKNATVGQKLTAKEVESESGAFTALVADGATVNNTLNAKDVVLSSSLVAPVVTADTVKVNGKITATEGAFNKATVASFEATNAAIDTANVDVLSSKQLTTGAATIQGKIKVIGGAEFGSDTLFNGNVSVNGGLTVAQIAAMNEIQEGGVFLKDKYLGINATAKNADKLGNVEAARYARRDQANTFNEKATFKKDVEVGKSLTVGENVTAKNLIAKAGVQTSTLDAKTVTADALTVNGAVDAATLDANSATITTLTTNDSYIEGLLQVKGLAAFNNHATFKKGIQVDGAVTADTISATAIKEQGVLLEDRYLGISAKAASASVADNALTANQAQNALKLGGIDAATYARKDQSNVFTQLNSFNGGIEATNAEFEGLIVDGLSYIGKLEVDGVAKFNELVTMNKGLTVKGGDLVVDSSRDVKVGNHSFKDLALRVKSLEENGGNGGGSSPQWHVVHEGSTNSLTLPSQYANFKMKVSYTPLKDGRYVNQTVEIVGVKGQNATIASTYIYAVCAENGDKTRITALVDESVTFPSQSISSSKCRYPSIKNVRITKFEAFY